MQIKFGNSLYKKFQEERMIDPIIIREYIMDGKTTLFASYYNLILYFVIFVIEYRERLVTHNYIS